jgi:hypothetical protein
LKNDHYPVSRLSKKEFADALQKGLGRAYLHAIHYGIDEVDDLVLKACLHDQASDPQSEDSKAEYLFAMFQNTQYLPRFKESILSALKTKRNTWDVQLLFKVALQIAKTGDQETYIAIREKAIKKAKKSSEDEWLGAQEWITLAGTDGAIELARIYGSRLIKNPEEYIPEGEIFPNEEFKNDFRNRLLEDSSKDPVLKAYWNYLNNRGVFKPRTGPYVSTETIHKRRKEQIRQRYNLNSILNDAKNKIDKYGSRFGEFGWAATTEELETIYKYLLNETDCAVIWRLLRVFNRVPLPGLDDKLFLWAHSDDSQVRKVAIFVLANNTNERVHALAKDKIQNSNLAGADAGSIKLFVNNYAHGDAKLITDALFRTRPNKEDAHELAWDVIHLSEKYHDVGLADTLKWAYEKTPCSACRYRIIEQLDLLGQFNDEILYECLFDGNGDIADLARNKVSV